MVSVATVSGIVQPRNFHWLCRLKKMLNDDIGFGALKEIDTISVRLADETIDFACKQEIVWLVLIGNLKKSKDNSRLVLQETLFVSKLSTNDVAELICTNSSLIAD